MKIIKDFHFCFHGCSHYSGWPKCIIILTHMESHWFYFLLHAGCGVECQHFSLATFTCLQPATIMPILFTSWTIGRCGRELGIVFRLFLLHTVNLLEKH